MFRLYKVTFASGYYITLVALSEADVPWRVGHMAPLIASVVEL
jgi:hypothetical protein